MSCVACRSRCGMMVGCMCISPPSLWLYFMLCVCNAYSFLTTCLPLSLPLFLCVCSCSFSFARRTPSSSAYRDPGIPFYFVCHQGFEHIILLCATYFFVVVLVHNSQKRLTAFQCVFSKVQRHVCEWWKVSIECFPM